MRAPHPLKHHQAWKLEIAIGTKIPRFKNVWKLFRRIGSKCTFTCKKGFEINGTSRTSCNKKALWTSRIIPECINSKNIMQPGEILNWIGERILNSRGRRRKLIIYNFVQLWGGSFHTFQECAKVSTDHVYKLASIWRAFFNFKGWISLYYRVYNSILLILFNFDTISKFAKSNGVSDIKYKKIEENSVLWSFNSV